MCKVGEETGQLDLVLGQLADHYQTQLDMRRNFSRRHQPGPVTQLVLSAASSASPIWIWACSAINTDLYGFGLVGNKGLAIYMTLYGGICVLSSAGW